jgi:ferredoxin
VGEPHQGPRNLAAGPAGPGDLALSHRLHVDTTRCGGHGLCSQLFPERVRRDDRGYPIVSPAPIGQDLLALAQLAVVTCPMLALSLERVSPRQHRTRGSLSP